MQLIRVCRQEAHQCGCVLGCYRTVTVKVGCQCRLCVRKSNEQSMLEQREISRIETTVKIQVAV